MKSKRQEKILELILNKVCLTQEDLLEGLKDAGFDVTQSTVSRDIKALKLSKGRDEQGNYRYLAPNSSASAKKYDDYYAEMFRRAAKEVKFSLNNVVIKCEEGMASSACVAVDKMFGDMMLGSLAGDDTIIIVTVGEPQSKLLYEKLQKLF